jgi:cyclic pyranopterin phosphate synthase
VEPASTQALIGDAFRADATVPPVAPSYRGEVARRWRYQDGSGELGDRLGHPAVLPHLRTCTRARLATDGKLYTCLFAAAGHDLRALLRTGASDQQLVEALAGIWAGRADRYSEQRASHTDTRQRIEMSYIGG